MDRLKGKLLLEFALTLEEFSNVSHAPVGYRERKLAYRERFGQACPC